MEQRPLKKHTFPDRSKDVYPFEAGTNDISSVPLNGIPVYDFIFIHLRATNRYTHTFICIHIYICVYVNVNAHNFMEADVWIFHVINALNYISKRGPRIYYTCWMNHNTFMCNEIKLYSIKISDGYHSTFYQIHKPSHSNRMQGYSVFNSPQTYYIDQRFSKQICVEVLLQWYQLVHLILTENLLATSLWNYGELLQVCDNSHLSIETW